MADEDVGLDFESMTLESKSDLVIGIDFGTTFTGVAYSHSVQAVPGDASKTAENVHVIKSWPSPNSSYMDKIPSIIAYNTDPPTWGGNVKARDVPQVAHFKLGLQPSARDHYLRGSSHNETSALAFLESDLSHPQLSGKKALDFAADYLTCVHTYVRDVLFPRQFGAAFLRNQQLSYVITVPAIWKDSAKALTREAATRAGIPNQNLELITEPEAAALYCATICNEVDLVVGDRFLVCDAGGGTVVNARKILL
jgi:molecular chaperone DnaK (HSP70)